jgi:hypothetical protein
VKTLWITHLASAVLTVGLISPFAHAQVKSPASTLRLGGLEYIHRWSKAGQNEYTPQGQNDLNRWEQMVTLNVHPQVTNGEQLADLANRILSRYQQAGTILRTTSRPQTPQRPAEHLIVAILRRQDLREAAFARLLLVEGVGVVVVVSRRAYGAKAHATTAAWLQANGEATERTLMSWNGLPSLSALQQLPQGR